MPSSIPPPRSSSESGRTGGSPPAKRVHVCDDRIEAFLGATPVVTHPRQRGRRDGVRVHCVNYRHVIHALRRKPFRRRRTCGSTALAGSVYRDGLFPRSEYEAAWAVLSAALPRRDACRRMVDLLWLAHDEGCVAPEAHPGCKPEAHLRCDAELAGLIAEALGEGLLPEARDLKPKLEPRRRELPGDTPVTLTDLASFDALLEGRA